MCQHTNLRGRIIGEPDLLEHWQGGEDSLSLGDLDWRGVGEQYPLCARCLLICLAPARGRVYDRVAGSRKILSIRKLAYTRL